MGQFQEDEHSEVFCQKHYLANHFLIQLRKEVLANFSDENKWHLLLRCSRKYQLGSSSRYSFSFLRKMGLNSADVLQYYLLNVACHITFFLNLAADIRIARILTAKLRQRSFSRFAGTEEKLRG